MAISEFTDKVRITIKAGDGGDGMNSFKAFKGKPACGPDGGDGGKGGNVYFVGDKDMNDLFSFRFTSKYLRKTAKLAVRINALGEAEKTCISKFLWERSFEMKKRVGSFATFLRTAKKCS